MNKTKLELININQDVIVTSIAHDDAQYHLVVGTVTNDNNPETCFVYKGGTIASKNIIEDLNNLPQEIKAAASSIDNNGFYHINLPDATVIEDTYYWNGQTWIKCSDKHNFDN